MIQIITVNTKLQKTIENGDIAKVKLKGKTECK